MIRGEKGAAAGCDSCRKAKPQFRYLGWPRLRRAVQAAHKLLLRLDPDGSKYGPFPINMKEIQELLNVRFIAAKAVSHVLGAGIDRAVCIDDPATGEIVVFMPEAETGRCMYNGAHEIGHIVCGHFDDFDIPWLWANAPKNRLAARTLAALDREAEAFAAELLMPLELVRHLNLDVEELQFYHCVSYSAARGRLRDLNDPSWAEWTQYNAREILAHCRTYIDIVSVLRTMR